MKNALQIYGVFRTFEHCLPQILNYIRYKEFDYDVYILSQKADGYSPENEAKIKALLGPRIVRFCYIEDYPVEIQQDEDRYCQEYEKCISEAKKGIQEQLITNDFVSRLWYRRKLTNQLRNDYERKHQIKYDWVVRTRFDIGYRTVNQGQQVACFGQNSATDRVYMYPDIISIGSPAAIDYESELILQWPYVYQVYRLTNQLPQALASNPEYINKWLFMSEMNLQEYMTHSPYQVTVLPNDLRIIRQSMVAPRQAVPVMRVEVTDPIIQVHYGIDQKWREVTPHWVREYAQNYDYCEGASRIRIHNEILGGDPAPGRPKVVVVTTLSNTEHICDEQTTVSFKYPHILKLNERIEQIHHVSYGRGERVIDVTKGTMTQIRDSQGLLYVSNCVSATDPCPGEEKILTIRMKNNFQYQIPEYTIVCFHPRGDQGK
jgi:hypothetical protein